MSDCPFCAVGERKWLENDAAIAFPDAYPIGEGQTLVAPRLHVRSSYELNAHQQSSVWELVAEVRQRLLVGLKPDAFNIGVNDRIAAGQTVDHAHVQVIPRWKGDVADPRGGIRWILDNKADYWSKWSPAPSPAEQVDFLNKLQRLLSEGLFTATYKYTLLSALAELSIEQGDDSGVIDDN